jgi:hypothetical protein
VTLSQFISKSYGSSLSNVIDVLGMIAVIFARNCSTWVSPTRSDQSETSLLP